MEIQDTQVYVPRTQIIFSVYELFLLGSLMKTGRFKDLNEKEKKFINEFQEKVKLHES